MSGAAPARSKLDRFFLLARVLRLLEKSGDGLTSTGIPLRETDNHAAARAALLQMAEFAAGAAYSEELSRPRQWGAR